MFFHDFPLGPGPKSAKSSIFIVLDLDWTAVGKQSFRQRAELVAAILETRQPKHSEPKTSCCLCGRFGARRPGTATESGPKFSGKGVDLV